MQKQINDIYQKLATAPDDTNLVKLNSDKGLDKYYYKRDQIESPLVRDTLMKVAPGTLIGPYFENGTYKIARLMDRREVPDSVRAHHILIAVRPGDDSTAARKRIDSIYNAVLSGTPFDSLAVRFSDDQGSGANGGDLGFAPQGIYVKNFNNFLFLEGKAGDMKVVRTEFGYHLIRIDEVKNIGTGVQVNFITRLLEASSETDKQLFDKASKFAIENNTTELFAKAGEEQKLNKMTAPSVQKNAYALPGLTSAREVVKWAFQAKPGEVSAPFALIDNYVVAVLTGIKPEGTATVDDVRPQLELQVRRQKKGEQIAAQISAAASLNATLEGIAAKVNQPVKSSSSVSFANAYSENIGYEPKVVGAVMSQKENVVSKPIIGEQGVFVVQVASFTRPEPIADYAQFSQQLMNTIQPRVQYGLAEALRKSVKIEDNRYLFF
jgi:peptidyl-prolyl cis-trans isomerase D